MVGNLLPDFSKKLAEPAFSQELLDGIALHRFIDSFTDTHPVVQHSKASISPRRRRFAGILIDIFYDHFLALHWEQYHQQTLYESTQYFYRELAKVRAPLPQRLQEAIARMPQIDLLYNYRTLRGMEHAVDRVAQRIRFKNELHGGVVELTENFEILEADFHLFFSDLREAVTVYKSPSL